MSPFRRLLGYVARYRAAFIGGLLCVLATQGVALTAPLVLQRAIDDLATGLTGGKLTVYGALLLAIGVVRGYFQFVMRRMIIGASRSIEYDMRNDFFAHLQRLPLSYFQTHRTGDLMSRATSDLNAVRMMIGPSVMYAANTILVFIVALAVMIAIDARLTLFSLMPLPFVSISVKLFGSAIHKRFERIQAQLSQVSAIAQESLSGVRVVRAYGQEQAELERFRAANLDYVQRNRSLIALQGFFFPSMSFFLGLGAMVVLWLGTREVLLGRITLGEFVAFNAYLTMLSWPMIAFGWVTNMIQRGMASWKRMLEVFDAPPAVEETQSAGSVAPPRPGEVEFRDLTFAFGTAAPVLRHVTATIPPGTTTALVGATGSGKSTLISLLARLHEPPRGAVFVDGVDVLDLPLPVLRGALGFVPQEPFLFSDTLLDNLAFGLDAAPGATVLGSPEGRGEQETAPVGEERRRRLLDAAAVARLDKDVADFPKGYETAVGERGITLSGGQKQRAALARAVAVDPRILILDDALSAVDTYTEEEILAGLRRVMRQRTSLIVSHRISTVRAADQILVLDEGQIVERGTHDDLIRQNGLYAERHRKQLLEEELAAS